MNSHEVVIVANLDREFWETEFTEILRLSCILCVDRFLSSNSLIVYDYLSCLINKIFHSDYNNYSKYTKYIEVS